MTIHKVLQPRDDIYRLYISRNKTEEEDWLALRDAYMHKSETVQEKETYETIWDFEIKRNHTIPNRRPDPVLIKQETNVLSSRLSSPADHKVQIKESKILKKYRIMP